MLIPLVILCRLNGLKFDYQNESVPLIFHRLLNHRLNHIGSSELNSIIAIVDFRCKLNFPNLSDNRLDDTI